MVFTIAKKKKESIKISFIDSPSSEDVTGSLIYISTPNHKFLVDAGLHQTNDRYEDFLINNRKYKEFKPKELDYVFITHSHSDHMNLLPKLFKDGCNARVIITEGTLEIIKDMMTDCAEINERDIVIINNQHDKKYEALYDIDDVHNTMNHIVEFPMKEKIKIDDELSFELIPSGHLLGSCQVLLYLTVNNITKTVLVTGDIGNKIVGNRFVGEYKQVKNSDYVIAESTYGDKPDIKTGRKERKNDLEKFKSIIDTQIHDLKGRVIIPSFAQSRSAQLVLMVYQLYKDSDWKPKVYIDSPLAIKLFKDYENCLDGKDKEDFDEMLHSGMFHFVKEPVDSKTLVASNEPCLLYLFHPDSFHNP